ncbi:MAG: hypothetical protein AAGE52_23785 [Myxococcota bacterium]
MESERIRSPNVVRLGGLITLVFFVACGDDDSVVDASTDGARDAATDGAAGIVADRPECENLLPIHCLLPYPSSHFLTDDATTESGFRVNLQQDMLPRNMRGQASSSTQPWNLFDGFSPMTSLIVAFDGTLDTTPLANELNIRDSLLDDSRTVLIDPETGERVAHFAEEDEWPRRAPNLTTLYLRPATRLKENHRYVAAVRTLRTMDGAEVEPSLYFRALRDGTPTDVAGLEARRPTMEGVFAELEAAGVEREDLLVAWEFRTASGASVRGDLLALRDDALRRVEEGIDGVGTCTVDVVDEAPAEDVFRRIRGTYTVPLYMTEAGAAGVANRDGTGVIQYNGTAEAPFDAYIPTSVVRRLEEGRGSGSGLMYGHGLLGAASQVMSGGPRAIANLGERVVFGTTYWGLSSDTPTVLAQVIPDFANFPMIGERLMQGTINSLLLTKVFQGACRELPEMQVEVDGELEPALSNEEPLFYYGISQGGIMGATLAALSEDVDAYALQVGAINYSLMLRRSADFSPFEAMVAVWYRNTLDRDWLVVSSQSMWDLAEPASYAPFLFRETRLVGGETPRVLYQTSRYDVEVNNAASDIAARTLGLPALASSVYEPFGLELTRESAPSAYVIYQLDDVEEVPIGTREPVEENTAHGDLRFAAPVIEQLDRFLRPGGEVVDTCPDGSCLIPNDRR